MEFTRKLYKVKFCGSTYRNNENYSRKRILLCSIIILIILSFIKKCDKFVNQIEVFEEATIDNCDFLQKISSITNSSAEILTMCKPFNRIFQVRKDGDPILTPDTMDDKIKSWLNNQQELIDDLRHQEVIQISDKVK